MKMTRHNVFFLALLLSAGVHVYAADDGAAPRPDMTIEQGPFTPDWRSLSEWECPEWFKDAKLGLWAHWGPQCQAETGDWYARGMYVDGSWQNKAHKEKFGDPAEFGFKDVCNDWKAEEWNPDSLVALYKSVGAKYFFALGQHHDNLDLWDSPYQEWNSVNVGPHKDILKGWSEACHKAGLPFGISLHAAHAPMFYEPSRLYDGLTTKADGAGKWWEGLDPQDLYVQTDFEPIPGGEKGGPLAKRWDWQNTTPPTAKFKNNVRNRFMECISTFSPDMIYFDDTVVPFWGIDEQVGMDIVAHYYNHSINAGNDKPQVVAMGKKLLEQHKDALLWDVERGVPSDIQPGYWQTCTCIGTWHYQTGFYNQDKYKKADQVVAMLMDIVSKNGNLLLSIPVKGNGTIDDKEYAILMDLKSWLDINGEAVYGTRPWRVFGEGPLAETTKELSEQGFNESNDYSAADVRYTTKDGNLYATILKWPEGGTFTFRALAGSDVKGVELLGSSAPVEYSLGESGLAVTVPAERPDPIAPVFKIML